MNSDWVTQEQAAEYLGVSVATVHRWVAAGKLKASKLGHRTVRISIASIEKMLEKSAQ